VEAKSQFRDAQTVYCLPSVISVEFSTARMYYLTGGGKTQWRARLGLGENGKILGWVDGDLISAFASGAEVKNDETT